jgi:uncharacterized ion transporter superfamily protein YfcC
MNNKILNVYKYRMAFFAVSIILILCGVAAMFINGVNVDIQFKGGAIIKYTYEGDLDNQQKSDIEKLVSDAIGRLSTVQLSESAVSKQLVLNLAGNEGLTPDEEAKILDTLLHGAVGIADGLPKWAVILFIYLIVLGMNFFIGSGSAKAFMLIPLIVPLAQIFGISSQLCIVAFAFGDGFSNVIYPTNAALLIGLGLADINYAKWFRWTIRFQIANLLLTSAILLFGMAIGY